MCKVIHDYKGRDSYHLIRAAVRHEFKILAVWVEHYNDSLPVAVGLTVQALNPEAVASSVLVDDQVSFMLYIDVSEIADVRDLLRTLFSQLDVVLWGNCTGTLAAMEDFITTEANHLYNPLMTTDKSQWRSKKLFGTPAIVRDVRIRLRMDPRVLPEIDGQVSVTGKCFTNDVVSIALPLQVFEEQTGQAFAKSDLDLTLSRYNAERK